MLLRQFPDEDQFYQMARQHNVVPVCAETLADTETPVSLMKKRYADRGPFFLLESAEGGERWGRYSFMGACARTHVRVFRHEVEIEENGRLRRTPHHGDPLPLLKEVMAGFSPAAVPGLPRFWGGMLGYMTYEMVSFFERIPNRLPDDRPLAHFIIPEEILVFDNLRHTLTGIVPVFMDEADDPRQCYRTARERVAAMLDIIERPMPLEFVAADPAACRLTPRIEPGLYQQQVVRVQEYIRAGDIIQAVVAQPFDCPSPPDLWSLYRAQRYINPSPYLYFLHLDDTALVGSSPETMVRLENGTATLRPIAGTRPRAKHQQEDRMLADELLKDEKERAEHLMLVDLGRNDLGRVARVGTVQVTDLMFVERYSHVMHLVSNICCDLKPECDAWDLLRATFPAGTLSGAPKVRAMEIIAEMESTPRGPYGGAVGYVSFQGDMDMAIVIRTACIQNGRMTVRAGAGLVADSDPEREHQETLNKARAIQKALQLMAQEEKR